MNGVIVKAVGLLNYAKVMCTGTQLSYAPKLCSFSKFACIRSAEFCEWKSEQRDKSDKASYKNKLYINLNLTYIPPSKAVE